MESSRSLENPILELSEVAVCLHFVEKNIGEPITREYSEDSVFRSMELDLLAYQFQVKQPLISENYSDLCTSLEIIFPEKYKYQSETRHVEMKCKRCTIRAYLHVSSTTFPESRIRVWHFVLSPDKDEVFTEYDIIKFIHLYHGWSEHTDLKDSVRFKIDKNEQDLSTFINSNISSISKGTQVSATAFIAGTIEIITQSARTGDIQHSDLFQTVENARQLETSEDYKSLKGWETANGAEYNILLAYCGIVTGIFDFLEIDHEELLDTLTPTFADSGLFIKIHKNSLISITESDRAKDEIQDYIGISPYLLIPHAVLLHNEKLVYETQILVDNPGTNSDTGKKKVTINDLRADYEVSIANLNSLYLPNIFNYDTEKTLIDKGYVDRGSYEKYQSTQNKVFDLKEKISIMESKQKDHSAWLFNLFMLYITILGLAVTIGLDKVIHFFEHLAMSIFR